MFCPKCGKDLTDNSKFFKRELLLSGPLCACLEKAVEDEKEMRE